MKTVVVTGTATEVGKTWVTAQLLTRLRAAGITVGARKPVQSFDPDDPAPTDAEVLAAAAGEEPHTVCPPHRWLPVPMAPPMAAAVLGTTPPTLADLCGELLWPDPRPDIGFVESVGGVRSPLADNGDSVDLVAALRPDAVLLVADASLGVIDRVRLAIGALGATPVLVYLNRFDDHADLHQRNRAWLRDRDGVDVETDLGVLTSRLRTI